MDHGPLQSSNNSNIPPRPPHHKSIEETYQKKTQLEHILLRPDTYIGSIEKHTATQWVFDSSPPSYNSETQQQNPQQSETLTLRSITYVPGLFKIFDEILVNAADNKQRDPKMDCVRVHIAEEENLISVYNNGDGVPVEIHKEEGVYVPEMIFGHLLTSSNYDDSMKKTTGGRNGYGAKLTNIFSKEFVIETADGKRQKKYKQVFSENMGKKTEPIITKCKETENWTKISFKPDLEKFKMTHLEEDVVALMKKRVYDIAGCLGKTVKVELNGKRVPVKSFSEYVGLYLNSASQKKPESDPLPKIYEKVNERWEVGVSLSEGQFQQVSFVNAIATIKGGTHVDYITNQLTNYIMGVVNKKKKNATIKPHAIKSHLWVFVNSLIDNPAFDSQTKETLTIRQSSFGSKCELSEDFLKKVAKSGVVENLLTWADYKLKKDLKKSDGSKKDKIEGIPKLEDAAEAGTSKSDRCTLILTEGDSAKSLAMAGLSVVGRAYYGIFPLRGKLLNVREASHKQIMENAEIQNIKKILGLQQGKQYDNVKSLRYGHLMIMTDQDHDGSHIKGLLINFIHSFWPSLLKIPSFMIEFITPIVKATDRNGRVISFYTIPEFESWKERVGQDISGWTTKYYKGLGTSTRKEAKEYFEDLEKHRKDFWWENENDGDYIELAFSKKKIEARKHWLRQFEPGTFLDQKEKLIKYSDFVNKELILFSMADLQRSIPAMVDGLKPGQRKILFCSFKKNFTKEAKVAQFSGYVSEHSAYHHGEQSLASTIIGMAQDFVGSNNINLLIPSGQFGTRHQGGKDHASARYIFTQLAPITRYLFPKEDDSLLDYLKDDGKKIEPTWYVPVIPMVLVNGSEGIGTGWSTFVPNYNPRDIVANMKRFLNGEPMTPMDPWYKGFRGIIEKTATKESGVSYTVSGLVEEINETTLRITELPIRRWTQDYKEFLESLQTKNDKKEAFIQEYRDYSDDTTVHFEVTLSEENMLIAKQEGLLKKFKLTTTISTSNMHLFDSKGVIKKYDNPEQILEEFFHVRLQLYKKRQKILLENFESELLKLGNKVRFILGVVEGAIKVSNRKKADICLELREKGFTPLPKKPEAVVAGETDGADEPEEEIEAATSERGPTSGDYDYLLQMPIGSLTIERVQKLLADREKLNADVEELRKSTPKSLWAADLNALDRQLDGIDKEDATEEDARKVMQVRRMNEAGLKVSRQAQKNPRNNTKKANVETTAKPYVSAMETDKVDKVVKPKGKAAPKKAPAKKGNNSLALQDEDDTSEDEMLALNERLAASKIESSPDNSEVMEVEGPEKQATKKPPGRRAAAKKKPLTVISDDEDENNISDDDDVENISDDDDFEVEVLKAPEEKKKGGRKPATAKAAKPPVAATKKRGPANKQQPQLVGQKLITDVLKPAGSAGISPEKKVRKMRASPFNKKSGSVLGRNTKDTSSMSAIGEENVGDGSTSSLDDISAGGSSEAAMPRVARPQRANRTKTTYILSDSESEEEQEDATDDSEFDEYDD